MKRLLALVPNMLGESPGQRVRIETWAGYLRTVGWEVELYPFEDAGLREVLYQPGHAAAKAVGLMRCYGRQLGRIIERPRCDLLLIYREAAIIGPAVIERLAARLRVPIVYDLDDPVFVPYRSPMNGWFSLLKFPRKTHALFKLAGHVIAINELIAQYAARFNPSVSVVPNCVDIEAYRPPDRPHEGALRLGWVGSHSTMPNLLEIAEPLRRLQDECGVRVSAIGAGTAEVPGVRIDVRQWSAATEVSDLQDCDVGLVPVPSTLPWNRWKFFYKTIQYMAIGLPVVASRVGSNHEIIEDGVNGFLVETPAEWYQRLQLLVSDESLRRRMGAAARKTVVERFSTQTQLPRVASILELIRERPARVGAFATIARSSGSFPPS